MSALAASVQARLSARAPGLAVLLPGGQRLGAPEAKVQLTLSDWASLAHLATGQVGRLGEDQITDYARRKRMSVEEVERWLASSLAYERVRV